MKGPTNSGNPTVLRTAPVTRVNYVSLSRDIMSLSKFLRKKDLASYLHAAQLLSSNYGSRAKTVDLQNKHQNSNYRRKRNGQSTACMPGVCWLVGSNGRYQPVASTHPAVRACSGANNYEIIGILRSLCCIYLPLWAPRILQK